MITLVVTILLIVVFLFVTRKRRSEYYEEGIGPSEDAPVRPRSLVHKLLKGVDKIEKKRTQDVILHDAFLKQVDMKAANVQGTQDEIENEIRESVDEELKFVKKYTGLVEDHIYENKTLPEDKTYDEVAEDAYDGLRKNINTQLMVKGQEYKERQISELALRTEQRQVMDKDVKDTTILKSDLGEGLQVLEDTLPKIEADANAIDAGDLPTSNLGTDALLSQTEDALNESSPHTQNMASLFASAAIPGLQKLPDVAPVNPGEIKEPSSTGDRPKLIQFSEVGNIFDDYYAIQDPGGYWSENGHKPIDPDTGNWRREKVQMKISCGSTLNHGTHSHHSRGAVHKDDETFWENSRSALPKLGTSMLTDALALFTSGGGGKPFEGPDPPVTRWGTGRRDSRYARYFYSRPTNTQGFACLHEDGPDREGHQFPATFQECSELCEKYDECSAFSIDPIFDTELGHYSRSSDKDKGEPFMSLTAGPDTINGVANKFKNKYWCKLQRYGARRFDIGTFSGETIFAKYEDGYLKDPLIKEHIAKKIDANTTDIMGQGDYAHPKFPRTCDEAPLMAEVSLGYTNGYHGYDRADWPTERNLDRVSGWEHNEYFDGIRESRTYKTDKGRSQLPTSVQNSYALPADSARFTNASWVYPDIGGACEQNGKNEKTAFPGVFRTGDDVDPSTQIQLGCPIQFRGQYNLGWVNGGEADGTNIVRDKMRVGDSSGWTSWHAEVAMADPDRMITHETQSLVLPGQRGNPKCPDGYNVRTENQPYCDPNTLTLSTPNVKCEPIMEQGACVAKEGRYQNLCSPLTERKCLSTPFNADQLGMAKLNTQTSLLATLQGGSLPRSGSNRSEFEKSENPFYKQSISGKMSSDVCDWKPHTFYDGQISRETEYDGKEFYILYKRSQSGTWSEGGGWNWEGGYDSKFKEWAQWFEDKGKIVLYNLDGTLNEDAVKYRAEVLKKMGGDFKPTEIAKIYYKMDDTNVTDRSKEIAEQAVINYHSGE